ncbi:MAG: DUF2330 domain-containing protein [Nitrospiraceae bacterium]
MVRHNDKTVITMANDFRGPAKEFAMLIPVPAMLTREQIHVGNPALLKHLAAYTAPRLVEYYDPNPCRQYELMECRSLDAMKNMAPAWKPVSRRTATASRTALRPYSRVI